MELLPLVLDYFKANNYHYVAYASAALVALYIGAKIRIERNTAARYDDNRRN